MHFKGKKPKEVVVIIIIAVVVVNVVTAIRESSTEVAHSFNFKLFLYVYCNKWPSRNWKTNKK